MKAFDGTSETVPNPDTPKISLNSVVKRFGNATAVDGVSLDVMDGDFLVLLGPSGCGKSTLLRMIAGLIDVTDGDILIDGRRATRLPPAERDLAFVFQNYALYPHMTVRRNLSFPLIMDRFKWWYHIPFVSRLTRRRLERSPEISARVEETASSLGIESFLDRRPGTLSGGQRQRVALGRAMVRNPVAFLMDEPLSNLDAKLRAQTREELLRFRRLLDTTIVYVTHDQVEAMTMGTKIGVMLDGELQQYGTPREVYEHPANRFVAQFVGTPAMSMLPVTVDEGGAWSTGGQLIDGPTARWGDRDTSPLVGEELLLGVRSEWCEIAPEHKAGQIAGVVSDIEDWGAERIVTVRLPQDTESVDLLDDEAPSLHVRVSHRVNVHIGDSVSVAVSAAHLCLFDARSGQSIEMSASVESSGREFEASVLQPTNGANQ